MSASRGVLKMRGDRPGTGTQTWADTGQVAAVETVVGMAPA